MSCDDDVGGVPLAGAYRWRGRTAGGDVPLAGMWAKDQDQRRATPLRNMGLIVGSSGSSGIGAPMDGSSEGQEASRLEGQEAVKGRLDRACRMDPCSSLHTLPPLAPYARAARSLLMNILVSFPKLRSGRVFVGLWLADDAFS